MRKIKGFILTAITFFLSLGLCNASDVELYHLANGIPVYYKNDAESKMTCVYVVVKGGILYLTPETSGLENSVFDLMTMGSRKYSYEKIKSFFYETQGGFTNYSINDGSVFGMTCISKYFDESFDIFEDSFFQPLFSEKQYELLEHSLQSSVAKTMNDPSGMLGYYMSQMIYSGHPYEAKTSVTQDSIENITLDAIKAYYKTLLDSRRINIVVSGNIDSEKIIKVLDKKFGKLGSQKTPLKEDVIPEIKIQGKPVVLCHQSASGAGFLFRAFRTPAVTDPDYAVARIVCAVYSDLLFNVVREKYGICYSSWSDITSSDAAFGYESLYRITNFKDFNAALTEARTMMQNGKLISGKDKDGNYITESLESRLEGYKNKYINGKYMTQQTVGGVCSRMAASLLQFGDVTSADQLNVTAKNCRAEDVLRVFNKYWIEESSQWFCVTGPEDETSAEKLLSSF